MVADAFILLDRFNLILYMLWNFSISSNSIGLYFGRLGISLNMYALGALVISSLDNSSTESMMAHKCAKYISSLSGIILGKSFLLSSTNIKKELVNI